MLYFFNVVEAGVEIRDPEGTELPGWDAAQGEAAAIVAELHDHFPGRFGCSSVLEVMTACGRRVMALPFHSAIA